MSQTSSTQNMNPRSVQGQQVENEKDILPAPNPIVIPKQHVTRSEWPQRYEIERPANATWAKDEPEAGPKTSQSFDLPLQGVRSDDWNSQYESAGGGVGEAEAEEPLDWGGYNFHRAVV